MTKIRNTRVMIVAKVLMAIPLYGSSLGLMLVSACRALAAVATRNWPHKDPQDQLAAAPEWLVLCRSAVWPAVGSIAQAAAAIAEAAWEVA
jgi:hypothetical protein